MMAHSRKEIDNGPENVGNFPLDESVYGVKDIAGNVSEWCNTLYDPKKNIRINRGAAWSYVEENYARCAYRNGHSPSDVADFRGFRMVVTLND
jgi:formylglycine-generating enzyme required for sulfatase activity